MRKTKARQMTGLGRAGIGGLLVIFLLAGCGSDPAADGDPADEDLIDEDPDDGDPGPSPTIFAPYTEDEKTVARVELDRYTGKWFEILTDVIPFQEGCTGSTATYSPGEDPGNIKVVNECYIGGLDGEYDRREARAEIVNPETNAELVVYFSESFGADYWVIELDGQAGEAPYEWAVVGSSFSIFLWVLSRTPTLETEREQLILDRLVERGYDLDDLEYTLQRTE